ncbi:AAA family ATPase [Paralcaligenes ureilyticus]|uniref:Exonuclease SbcC n=1 Tax=Paralcaligenes ureilyticus TaxID=627131 RepID=A0A4R3MDN1_9BURK|nr:AAA family ATPase [Paralcaligenes ureilyticus]TCT11043.1 exonuclease SbcC [Paralcaligenes ureilyticus]
MIPRLKSVTITDFRSIRGTVTVPLDSPVVLIHGQNGAGKTSLLSAIELGLTGQVASLVKIDSTSSSHLVHKEATEGQVSVTVEGLADLDQSVKITSTNRSFSGKGLLSPELSRFYGERCYLAQSTLARLLEIYQHKDARLTDSPLTKFVKDLLGLDQLDALVEGLHDAGNVRRLRNGAPLYWDMRDAIPKLEGEIARLTKEQSALNVEIQHLTQSVQSRLMVMGLPEQTDIRSQQVLNQLQSEASEPELQRLAKISRDIGAVIEQWSSVQSGVTAQERDAAEVRLKIASEVLQCWRDGDGKQLESVLSAMAAYFSDLPSPSSTRPTHARSVALETVSTELKRCRSILARDVDDTKQLAALDEGIGKSRSRIAILDEQIAKHAAASGSLAEALNSVLSHVHSEECPVCSRDFGEISDKPLSEYLASQISALTASAGRLRTLSKERVEGSTLLTNAEQSRALVAGRLLTNEARDDLKTRVATLSEFELALQQFEPAAIEGEKCLNDASDASASLNVLRAKDQKATTIRAAAQKFTVDLSIQPIGESEPLVEALQRFQSHVSTTADVLTAKESARRDANAGLKQFNILDGQTQSLTKVIADNKRRLARMSQLKVVADRRITQAKELSHRARDQRTAIVRRVFNESLNAIWRDLFVRLAPDEPFVPAFALPESDGGAVEAVLETLYRSGGKGGNPRAMLSAGNLNTAALTLFLALHLSVKPALPWLLIDDPIQSMDEVHIAQFAALLRTLSKQHGRQIVVAVHEKPLFDYLALELSPAFQSDRLITIDIGRAADGKTVVNYEPQIWVPDQAVAA